MTPSGFARLRRFEFRQSLGALNPRRLWMLRWSGSRRWERIMGGIAAVITVLIMWVWAASMRAPEVNWAGLGELAPLLLREPFAVSLFKLSGLILSWLAWGLGGLILILATLYTGWGWRERSLLRTSSESARPQLELLPLTDAQVARAKWQGRLAGWLVWATAGGAVSFLATRLMVLFRVVNAVPPLIDPWLVTCFFLFLVLMTVSRETALVLRRRDQSAAFWRLVVLLAGAMLGPCLANQDWLYRFHAWNIALGAGLVWLGMQLARTVPYPPTVSPLEVTPGWLAQLFAPLWPWLDAVFHGARVTLLATNPPMPWLTRVRRLLPAVLLLGVLAAGLGALLQCLVLLGVYLLALYRHVPLALGLGAGGPFYFALPVVAELIVFANFLMLGAWWPEFPPPQQTRRTRNPWAQMHMRHLGFLLPIPARRRWLQGLSAYSAALVLLLPLGATCWWVVWTVGQRLSGFPLGVVGPRTLLALPLGVLVGLMAYNLAPMMRHMSRVIGLNGCLLSLPFYGGLLAAMMISVRLMSAPHAGPRTALAMAAWVLLMLGMSYWWIEPRTWRRAPDGSAVASLAWRAVLTLLAMFVGFGFVLAGVFAVVAYVHFG